MNHNWIPEIILREHVCVIGYGDSSPSHHLKILRVLCMLLLLLLFCFFRTLPNRFPNLLSFSFLIILVPAFSLPHNPRRVHMHVHGCQVEREKEKKKGKKQRAVSTLPLHMAPHCSTASEIEDECSTTSSPPPSLSSF